MSMLLKCVFICSVTYVALLDALATTGQSLPDVFKNATKLDLFDILKCPLATLPGTEQLGWSVWVPG